MKTIEGSGGKAMGIQADSADAEAIKGAVTNIGLMYAQLRHTGAMSHPEFFGGDLPMSASDVNPEQDSVTPLGRNPTVALRPTCTTDICQTVADFGNAARNAMNVTAHDRRRILQCRVTSHPTSAWVIQQSREAFPSDSAPGYLIFDRGLQFNDEVIETVKSFGIQPKRRKSSQGDPRPKVVRQIYNNRFGSAANNNPLKGNFVGRIDLLVRKPSRDIEKLPCLRRCAKLPSLAPANV